METTMETTRTCDARTWAKFFNETHSRRRSCRSRILEIQVASLQKDMRVACLTSQSAYKRSSTRGSRDVVSSTV
jgi:hypothetical protein